jgi:hypothetical protein
MTKIGMCCMCGNQFSSRHTKIVKAIFGEPIEICRHCWEDDNPDGDFADVRDLSLNESEDED